MESIVRHMMLCCLLVASASCGLGGRVPATAPQAPYRSRTAAPSHTEGVSWLGDASELSESDRRQILSVSSEVGFGLPLRIMVDPGYCAGAVVESPHIVDGSFVTWRRLHLQLLDYEDCRRHERRRPEGRGRWSAQAAELRSIVGWRIEDGPRIFDVEVGRAVSYEDARRLVLAVHHGWLVDRRRRRPAEGPDLSTVVVERITRDDYPEATHRIDVGIPDRWVLGYMLWVRVLGTSVELIGTGLSMPVIH